MVLSFVGSKAFTEICIIDYCTLCCSHLCLSRFVKSQRILERLPKTSREKKLHLVSSYDRDLDSLTFFFNFLVNFFGASARVNFKGNLKNRYSYFSVSLTLQSTL